MLTSDFNFPWESGVARSCPPTVTPRGGVSALVPLSWCLLHPVKPKLADACDRPGNLEVDTASLDLSVMCFLCLGEGTPTSLSLSLSLVEMPLQPSGPAGQEGLVCRGLWECMTLVDPSSTSDCGGRFPSNCFWHE